MGNGRIGLRIGDYRGLGRSIGYTGMGFVQ